MLDPDPPFLTGDSTLMPGGGDPAFLSWDSCFQDVSAILDLYSMNDMVGEVLIMLPYKL